MLVVVDRGVGKLCREGLDFARELQSRNIRLDVRDPLTVGELEELRVKNLLC